MGGYDTPALRRGVLLEAKVKKPNAPGYEPVSRSAEQARELGNLICSHFKHYERGIRDSVRRTCAELELNLSRFAIDGQNTIRSKYAPGLILDFPTFTFAAGQFGITGRCCLTVCFNDSASKIWSRLVLNQIGEKDAFEASEAQAAEFFSIASVASNHLLKKVRRLYLADFREMLPRGNASSINFDTIGELTYLGFDEDPQVVDLAVREVDRARDSRASPKLGKVYEKLGSLVKFVDAEHRGGAPLQEEQEVRLSPANVRVYRPRGRATGLFLSRIGSRSATFAITAARSESPASSPPGAVPYRRPSSSLSAMADMANVTARKF